MKHQRITVILLASIIAATTARIIRPSNDADSGSSEDESFGEFLAGVSSKCLNQTGSNEAYDQVLTTGFSSLMCVQRQFDLDGFMAEVQDLDEHNRVPFFTKYCPQLKSTVECLIPITTEIRKCLDADEAVLLDIVSNIYPEAIDLLCRNNGEIIFDSNLLECGPKISEYVDTCVDQMSNATLSMELHDYGLEQCNEMSQVRECFQGRFRECKSPRMIELFDLFYRPMVKASPCKNFTQFDEFVGENEIANF